MDILLGPICTEIQSLCNNGIVVNVGSQRHVLRPKLLMAIFDLPARAQATNTKQFNGSYGCFFCTDEGIIHERARIYHPDAAHNIRTTEEMQKWATEADRTGVPQY